MPIFSYFSTSTKPEQVVVDSEPKAEPVLVEENPDSDLSLTEASLSDTSNPSVTSPVVAQSPALPSDAPSAVATPNMIDAPSSPAAVPEQGVRKRRFSFKPFAAEKTREALKAHKASLNASQEEEKKAKASLAFSQRLLSRPVESKSDKKAMANALVVRSLIVGTALPDAQKPTAKETKPQINKIKSQLLEAKTANKLIQHLRDLPATEADAESPTPNTGPVHAVCLEHTEAEVHQRHFSKLDEKDDQAEAAIVAKVSTHFTISSISAEKLATLFSEMHLVNLITAPDLGLGQPGDGEGLLAGALPTAETVIKGIEQITPQLMALGYATGRAALPDHTGVYPPLDRMSVLTYWWGLELALPPPSIAYLDNVHSISDTLMNFLSAAALVDGGVKEILPFVRYISQYVDFEFNSIKSQNKGKGVVCAATWIMPAAMVPRPWDFPDPPPKSEKREKKPDTIPEKVEDDVTGDTYKSPTAATVVGEKAKVTEPATHPMSPTITVTSATPSADSITAQAGMSLPNTPKEAPSPIVPV